jgi:hypothetical protein
MKKLTAISILLVLLSVTAFAQLKVGFTSNIWTDAIFFEKATGDMADADSVKGATNIFAGTNLNSSELRLTFKYTGGNYEAFLEISGDALVSRGSMFQYRGAFDSVSGDPIFGYYDETGLANGNLSLWSILTRPFGDFYVKTTSPAWVFTGYVGNTANRGKVDGYRFANFNDFVNNKLENYGAIMLGGYTGVGPTAIDTGKAFKGGAGTQTDTDNLNFGAPYIALGIDLNALSIPLAIEVASNAAFTGFTNAMTLSSYSEGAVATSAESIAGVFRVSGGKYADFISFDAVYRINGGDANTRLGNNPNLNDPIIPGLTRTDGPGTWNNEIGVYAGIDLFSGFSIGAGYTAAFQTNEKYRMNDSGFSPGTYDADENGAIVERVNPLFSGIDLHLGFTGIDKLTIALTNNFSFAFQKGQNKILPNAGSKWIQPMGYFIPSWRGITNRDAASSNKQPIASFATLYGLTDPGDDGNYIQTLGSAGEIGGNMWNTDQKDSWIALWNTLGVTNEITDRAVVSVVLSNNLGVYDFVAKPGDTFAKWTTDEFQAGVGATYAFSPNVSFGAGLNLSIWGMTAQLTKDKVVTDGQIGELRLAIPLQFKVTF